MCGCSWQRGLNPPILWRPPPPHPILPTLPPFSNFVQPPPLLPPTPTLTALSVALFLWPNGWLHHNWCAILLNIMDPHVKPWYLSASGALMCILCNKVSSLVRSDTWFFGGTLIWYHIHTDTLRGQQTDTTI